MEIIIGAPGATRWLHAGLEQHLFNAIAQL